MLNLLLFSTSKLYRVLKFSSQFMGTKFLVVNCTNNSFLGYIEIFSSYFYLNHFFVQKSVYALIKVSFKRHVMFYCWQFFWFSLWNAFDANTDNFVCLVMTRIIPEFTTLYTTKTLFPLFIISNNYTFSQICNILRHCSVQCEGWVFLQI